MMNLIQLLEREGGHIAVLVFLLLIFMAVSQLDPDNALIAKGGDMVLGALLLAMKGNGNGKKTTESVQNATASVPAIPPAEKPQV